MRKGCIFRALVMLVFMICLCAAARTRTSSETYSDSVQKATDSVQESSESEKECSESGQADQVRDTESQEIKLTAAQMADAEMTDLTDAFAVILNGVTKEFISGYAIDDTFLMWLDACYGDELIIKLACQILDGELNPNFWYEETGNSMYVLWLNFCRDSGYEPDELENVYWYETADASQAVFGFTGDFNFAEDWCTTEYMSAQPNGIADCFSAELLAQMRAADVLIMNNEFVYMQEGKSSALSGKAYTFRANPETVELLNAFGTDVVTLANNHVYDYGETGLLDTMYYLENAGIEYVGAGVDIDEASEILYYVVNGRKVAIVSATQIERTKAYTKEATENSPGVLKTLNPDRFVQVIEKADANSDYVIAVAHWGSEGTLYPEASQRTLAERFVAAGADAIIGGHPHRLQGIDYVQDVPVAFSLGNFWFSDGTLYTTVAQVIIEENGSLQMRFLPCEQRDMVTSLLTEQEEKDGFYHYIASISMNIGIDAEGNVYDKEAADYPADLIVYDSDTSNTMVRGVADNEGNAIDIVGNRK